MIYLILIGGGLFVVLAGISVFWLINLGKKKERYEAMENGIKEALKTKKRRILRRNDTSSDVRKRVHKYARD